MANSDSNTRQEWQDYRTRLLRFVRSRVYDDVMAEDIVHDALVKAWSRKETLSNHDAIIPWLFQITMNTVRDAMRKRNVMFLGDSADEVPNASDEVLLGKSNTKHDYVECLTSMLDTLTPENRQTLVRSEIDGVPMKVIADELGLSVSAIKSRVQRSRLQLRDAMMACCKVELNTMGQIINADEHDCSCSVNNEKACSTTST